MLRTPVIRNHAATVLTMLILISFSLLLADCGNGGKDERAGHQGIRSEAVKPEPRPTPEPAGIVVPETVATSEPPVASEEGAQEPRVVSYEEAETAFFEKRYDEAVDLFSEYTGRESDNPWGFYMLGLSAWKTGEYEVAEDAFEMALALDSRHVKSLLNWSRVLLDTDRPRQALAKLDQATEIDPESGVAYRLLGRAYHQLDQPEEAVAAYRQAIQLDESDAWSMNNMGLVFIEEGLYDKALPPLARAVEVRDDVDIFRNNLGMALEHSGDFRAAVAAYESAVALDSTAVKPQNNLERLAAVAEEGISGITRIDLAEQSALFRQEIEDWQSVSAPGDLADSGEDAASGDAGSDISRGDAETAMADEADSTAVSDSQ